MALKRKNKKRQGSEKMIVSAQNTEAQALELSKKAARLERQARALLVEYQPYYAQYKKAIESGEKPNKSNLKIQLLHIDNVLRRSTADLQYAKNGLHYIAEIDAKKNR